MTGKGKKCKMLAGCTQGVRLHRERQPLAVSLRALVDSSPPLSDIAEAASQVSEPNLQPELQGGHSYF